MNEDRESEASLPSQPVSPAPDNRSEGKGQGGVGANFRPQSDSPAQNRHAEGGLRTAALAGKQALNKDVDSDGERGGQDVAVAGDSGGHREFLDQAVGNGKGSGQDVTGQSGGSEQQAPGNRAMRDEKADGQSGLNDGHSVPGKNVGDEPPVPLSPQTANHEGSGQAGSGEGREIVRTRKNGEREADLTRRTENEKSGGKGAPVIPLTSSHHRSSSTPGGSAIGKDLIGSQASSRLKSILPRAVDGWWEVRDAGRGLSLKFRWRDRKRHTLAFPRITGSELRSLTDATDEEAAGMIRRRIAVYLQELTSNPAKRDKALTAAEKLGMDLEGYEAGSAKN